MEAQSSKTQAEGSPRLRDTKGSVHRQRRRWFSPPVIQVTQFQSRNSEAAFPGRRGREGRAGAQPHGIASPLRQHEGEEKSRRWHKPPRESHLRPRGSTGVPAPTAGRGFRSPKGGFGFGGTRLGTAESARDAWGEGAQPAARPSLLGPEVVEGQQDHAVRQERSFGS